MKKHCPCSLWASLPYRRGGLVALENSYLSGPLTVHSGIPGLCSQGQIIKHLFCLPMIFYWLYKLLIGTDETNSNNPDIWRCSKS